MLKEKKIPKSALFETVPQLLPTLKTNLEDYDASSRHLVTLSLSTIFEMLPGAFGEEPIRQLYPELLKRLDDSSDEVRISVCTCFIHFFHCTSPVSFAGGILDYTLDQLMIHLDDPDATIQNEVSKVVKEASIIDRDLVIKKLTGARDGHRSSRVCDDLLKSI